MAENTPGSDHHAHNKPATNRHLLNPDAHHLGTQPHNPRTHPALGHSSTPAHPPPRTHPPNPQPPPPSPATTTSTTPSADSGSDGSPPQPHPFTPTTRKNNSSDTPTYQRVPPRPGKELARRMGRDLLRGSRRRPRPLTERTLLDNRTRSRPTHVKPNHRPPGLAIHQPRTARHTRSRPAQRPHPTPGLRRRPTRPERKAAPPARRALHSLRLTRRRVHRAPRRLLPDLRKTPNATGGRTVLLTLHEVHTPEVKARDALNRENVPAAVLHIATAAADALLPTVSRTGR